MKKERPPLMKFTSTLYRITQAYTDEAMKKYELSSGTYPFLLRLDAKEGISQNKLCKELEVDKAMAARAINKLMQLGYITKENDEVDSRAYKLYLTEKAKKIIPHIRDIMHNWIDFITEDFNEQEKDQIVELTERALNNAKRFKKNKLIKDERNE